MEPTICPECEGFGYLCSDDPESCEIDGCDGCKHNIPCNFCKTEGMVPFWKFSRWAERMSKIKWGIASPK